MTVPAARTAVPTPGEVIEMGREDFPAVAVRIAAFQRERTAVYKRYCDAVLSAEGQIDWPPPYLPVAAFKHESVCAGAASSAQKVFESSGTTGTAPSRHHVLQLDYYTSSLEANFRRTFGDGPFRILAHLPKYAERSSLVFMLGHLIERLGAPGSQFFLDSAEPLLKAATAPGPPLMLFGAAFGLLDLIESAPIPMPSSAVVVETGGMKTHRRAMSRQTLHDRLLTGFGLDRNQLWSEYGMCEMLSQCYAASGAPYEAPPWVHARIVDPERPDREMAEGESGALAIADLANVHSCSFLLTEDRALRTGAGFEVLGRMTGAELRGCNHLLERA